jgi:hypothetical protein
MDPKDPAASRLAARAVLVVALLGGAIAIVHFRQQLSDRLVEMTGPRRSPLPPGVVAPSPPPPRLPPKPKTIARIPRVTLAGPGGDVELPLPEPHLVNVWLERCADCMPHFEAWLRLVDAGDVPPELPVVNVAFGRADLAWAAAYAVAEDVAFDPGHVLVRPLGITKFTTMLVRADGSVAFHGHPGKPGFREALQRAHAALLAEPPAPPRRDADGRELGPDGRALERERARD